MTPDIGEVEVLVVSPDLGDAGPAQRGDNLVEEGASGRSVAGRVSQGIRRTPLAQKG